MASIGEVVVLCAPHKAIWNGLRCQLERHRARCMQGKAVGLRSKARRKVGPHNKVNQKSFSSETKLTYIELDKEIARSAAEQLEFASIISGDTLDPEIIKEARVGIM